MVVDGSGGPTLWLLLILLLLLLLLTLLQLLLLLLFVLLLLLLLLLLLILFNRLLLATATIAAALLSIQPETVELLLVLVLSTLTKLLLLRNGCERARAGRKGLSVSLEYLLKKKRKQIILSLSILKPKLQNNYYPVLPPERELCCLRIALI